MNAPKAKKIDKTLEIHGHKRTTRIFGSTKEKTQKL
jgi:hypothetical protein